MWDPTVVGGKDDDDMLGFPGDTFKDTKTVEVEDPLSSNNT